MVSGNVKLLKAYHKRKVGLFKKVRELSTLCDIKVCVIAYGPNSTVPETWPPDPSAVVQLIREYRNANKEEVRNSKKKKIPAPSDKGLMYADGGSCYYANGNSSNILGFASQGLFNIQCEWQCRVPVPLYCTISSSNSSQYCDQWTKASQY